VTIRFHKTYTATEEIVVVIVVIAQLSLQL
jgi:hypothetical protein